MALVSRHYRVLQAVYDSMAADSDLTAAIPVQLWNIQKHPWHRTQAWEPGVTFAASRRITIPHENRTLLYRYPVICVVVWPSDASLKVDQAARMAFQERIEDLFNLQGRSMAPAPVRALDSAFTGSDKFTFQLARVQPGEIFAQGAFQAGLDVLANLIEIECIACKVNYSSLGS